MHRRVLEAWQAWRGKAAEPDCGRDAPPTQAAHLVRGQAARAKALIAAVNDTAAWS